jgi:hypothetical protein
VIAADVAAFDADVTRRAPQVPWWTPQKVQDATLDWFWRCRLCWVRVGVVQFPTRHGCLRHLAETHGLVP